MARGSRRIMKSQAKVVRVTGEPVTLLIPAATAPSTATPLSISKSNKAVDLSTATEVRVYANVKRSPGQYTYGEGGRTILRVASLEITADYANDIAGCYAVRFADGQVMLKKSDTMNASGTVYTLQVESHINDK